MKRILVIRFSSMGDVLLTAPILRSCVESNPDIKIDFLSKSHFAPYLSSIEGLNVLGIDTAQDFRGLGGIFRLSKKIRKEFNPDIIIDLHGVLRSRFISFLFSLRGIKTFRIDKGRSEKKDYLKGKNRKELIHTVDRYKEVFDKAGIKTGIVKHPFNPKAEQSAGLASGKLKAGISFFARHQAKTWPISYMVGTMEVLNKDRDIEFHFYGSKEDAQKLEHYDFNGLTIVNHAGRMSQSEEMDSISRLDFFISMDSANMHLADLLGVKVFSIWGGTHPDLGFRPLNQPASNAIQTEEELSCRPCSVFGNKACKLKDSKYKCLLTISPTELASKILSSIS